MSSGRSRIARDSASDSMPMMLPPALAGKNMPQFAACNSKARWVIRSEKLHAWCSNSSHYAIDRKASCTPCAAYRVRNLKMRSASIAGESAHISRKVTMVSLLE